MIFTTGSKNGEPRQETIDNPRELVAKELRFSNAILLQFFSKGGIGMDAIRTGRNLDRLTLRRSQLVATLRHLDKEQRQVEQNTDWLDRAAYESRVRLLDRLNEWSLAEINQIDRALHRIKTLAYGVCLGCHHSIETGRLDAAPEVEFCGACQELREGLERAEA